MRKHVTYSRQRKTPNGCVILPTAVALVLACYLIWLGGLDWLENAGNPSVAATRQAENAEATQTAIAPPTLRSLLLGPTRTAVPECQMFFVDAERGYIRECPALSCEPREIVTYQRELCVYGEALQNEEYPDADEWYTVDLNPEGAFRDIAYMHRSLLSPLNPTPRPTRTFTPLPTITQTPSLTPPPTLPSPTPRYSSTPSATPTITPVPSPSPTTFRIDF